MRLTIALLTCFLVAAVQGALPMGRVPQKTEFADCMYNQDDNSMELSFYVQFNGDPTAAFFAVEGPELRRPDGSTNIRFCAYGGSLSSFVSVSSKVYLDGRASVNPCGVQETFTGSNVYHWYFESREYWDNAASSGIITDMDARYLVSCDIANSQQHIASPTTGVVNFREHDDEIDVPRVDQPSSRMSILTGAGFVQSSTSGIRRGEAIKLLVQTDVKADGFRNENLDPYGSFVHTCDYRTSFTGQGTTFITTNGCPNTQFRDLTTGFIFQRREFTTGTNNWYLSETDSFVLAPTSSNFAVYYITCYIGFCYGPHGSDERCSDYCGYNTNRFNRRSIENTDNLERISISVNIIDEQETQEEARTGVDSGTLVVAIVSGVTIIVLVAIIVLVIMVCLRRRQSEAWEDQRAPSAAGSNLNLPQHKNVQVRRN